MVKCKGKFSGEIFILDGKKLKCSEKAKRIVEDMARKYKGKPLGYNGMPYVVDDWMRSEGYIWILLNNIDDMIVLDGEVPIKEEYKKGMIY